MSDTRDTHDTPDPTLDELRDDLLDQMDDLAEQAHKDMQGDEWSPVNPEDIFDIITLVRRQEEEIERLKADREQLRGSVRKLTDPSIICDEDRKALAGFRDDLRYVAKMKELRAEIERLMAQIDAMAANPDLTP